MDERTSPAVSPSGSPIFRPLSSTALRAIRLVVIASGDFTAGRSDAEVFEQIFSALENANNYLRPLRLRLELAGVQSFQPGAGDPYADAAKRKDANAMLDLARADWTGRSYPEHDLVAVFGRSAFGATYGLAYPSTICVNSKFAYLFVSQGGTSEAAELSFGATLAHEVGHTVGLDHDSKFYPAGPSLMWPFFAANVNGLSDVSLNEFADFESYGGTACLGEIAGSDVGDLSTPGVLSFAGGPEQSFTIAEGERFKRRFSVLGNYPGATYTVESLPPGAGFDPATGTIDYTPVYSLLSRSDRRKQFDVFITAHIFQLSSPLLVRLNVTAKNQVPVITASDANLTEGVRFTAEFSASDPDAGDRAVMKLLNKGAVKSLPGKPRLQTRRTGVRLDWTPPLGASGMYPVSFSARDRSGAETVKTIVLRVDAAEVLPEVIAPTEVIAANGLPLRFSLEVKGTAAAHELSGLEPGMLVTERDGKISVQYSPADGAAESAVLKLVMPFRNGPLSRAVPVFVEKGISVPGVSWPGAAGALRPLNDINGDGDDDVSFYTPLSGAWRHVACSGATGQKVFGGVPGDLPVIVHRGGAAIRALYRVQDGQGYWYLDNGSAPVRFGLARDVPLAADLDGDGEDELLVYRPRTGEWFSAVNDTDALRYVPFAFSDSERVVPFAADVDGDGKAELIRFRRTSEGVLLFEVRLGGGSLLTAVVDKAGLSSVVTPFVLDRDGDGRADLGAQKAGGGAQWFTTAAGRLVSIATAPVQSQSIFALRRCGAGAAELVSYDQLSGADLSEVTPESAGLRAANSFGSGGFADVESSGAASLAVWREDPASASAQWITRTPSGAAAFFPELPSMFNYQTALKLDSVFASYLTVYGDGVWMGQKRDGKVRLEHWGAFGDVPVPGDYNGDGRSDLAIYRSSDSSWWILLSDISGSLREAKVVRWGKAGDVPVPADYDGDGATDIAIWRPVNGTWAIILADGRVRTQSLGFGTDIPVPGDYRGTGKSELAVYRASSGVWLIQFGTSKDTIVTEQWGFGSDVPVSGDYDGDGQSDLAVWREAEGKWYLRNSGDAAGSVVQFGLPGDKPLGAQKLLRIF